MYPNSVLMSMCLGMDAAVNFGIGLAIWAGHHRLATVVFALLFYRQHLLEARGGARRGRELAAPGYKGRRLGMTAALVNKDSPLRHARSVRGDGDLFSNVVLAPIVMAVMFFFMQRRRRQDDERIRRRHDDAWDSAPLPRRLPLRHEHGGDDGLFAGRGVLLHVAKALPYPAQRPP